jgi:hypothetical protein
LTTTVTATSIVAIMLMIPSLFVAGTGGQGGYMQKKKGMGNMTTINFS